MDDRDLGALGPFFEEEDARRRLLAFASRVYPGFQSPPLIVLLAQLLERVERGELRRLMVNVSVRHGKSVACSQIFPAWFLGRHPRLDVILASHAQDLADRNSRIAKSLTQDDRWPFAVRLSPDSTAVARWNTTEGGGCYAIGVGGAITGRGANCLIIDDALHDGLSESECESAWRWYSEVAIPRLEPSGVVVVIGARFTENDLCGRILASEDGPNWHVVTIPAIAGENDPLFRAPGEALWPERFGLAELQERRVAMGSRAFEAQFQQNPLPAGGDLVKLDWLSVRYKRLPEEMRVVAALDAATKTGLSNDYSVIVVLGIAGNAFYVLDVVRRKVEYPDLRRMVEEVFAERHPSRMYIEDAANGTPLVQQLKRETRFPIVSVVPRGSKVARFEAVSGMIEAKRVQLPAADEPWVDPFVRELLSFPGGRFDDQCDALVLALSSGAAKSLYLGLAGSGVVHAFGSDGTSSRSTEVARLPSLPESDPDVLVLPPAGRPGTAAAREREAVIHPEPGVARVDESADPTAAAARRIWPRPWSGR